MKRSYSLILVFFIQFTLFDCISVDSNYKNKKMYEEIISLYPQKLVDHLSSYSNGNVLYISLEFPRGNYLSYIYIIKKLSNDSSQLLQDRLQKKSMVILPFKKYKLIASDNFVPLDFQNTIQFVKTNNNIHKVLPIPGFEFYPNTRLPKDFETNAKIYLLDCEAGKFLNDENLSYDDYSKKEWIHGFSKGVVLYKRYVIYWLDVW